MKTQIKSSILAGAHFGSSTKVGTPRCGVTARVQRAVPWADSVMGDDPLRPDIRCRGADIAARCPYRRLVAVSRCVFLAALVCTAVTEQLLAQGTAFTYQGRLNDTNGPVNDVYDLEFRVFDMLSGGSQQGSATNVNDLSISNGLFTVTLNPGANVFTGAARWLAIAVRPGASAGAYTDLLPRQPITPTPYAIYSGKAMMLDGMLPSSQLAGTYSSAVTLSNAANSFTGNGAGLIGLNANNLASGTVPDARLSNNVARLNAHQTFTGSNTFSGALTVFGGRVGIGTTVPQASLHAVGSDFGIRGEGPNIGIYARNSTSGYVAYLATPTLAADFFGDVSCHGTVFADGKVGIGTSPQLPLEVGGSARFAWADNGYLTVDDAANARAGLVKKNGSGPMLAHGSAAPFIIARSSGTSIATSNTFTTEFYIDTAGNVGIGTTSPPEKLSVNGTVKATTFQGDASALTGVPWSGLTGVPAGFADGIDNDTTYTPGAGLSLNNTTFSIAPGGVDTLKLGDSSVSTAKLQDGSVNNLKLASSAVTAAKIASSQVVKSLNSLKDDVTLTAGANVTLTPSGNTIQISASTGSGWGLIGNGGTTPGVNFLGTTDNQALELKVNGRRALRLEPTANDADHSNIVNVVGGSPGNFVGPGVYGATIAGGGAATYPGYPFATTNEVTAEFGTVGGGIGNTASGDLATISGGGLNTGGSGSTVGGGLLNSATGPDATIGGGSGNIASGGHSTIGGGDRNRATGIFNPTVGGGQENTASDYYATVSGGLMNTAGGGSLGFTPYATVSGGYTNVASAEGATVAGGSHNTAGGFFSFAAGRRAKALHAGAFVWNSTGADFSSTGPNQFLIGASGGVGIGTTIPSSALQVAGTVKATAISAINGSVSANDGVRQAYLCDGANAGFFVGPVLINGNLQVNGSVSGIGPYNNISDARFKTNIIRLTVALGKVLRLRGVGYDWRQAEHPEKNFEPGRQIGFIAQEVKEVLPEVVSQDAEGFYSIAYSKIIPVVVEAIKEQQNQIEKARQLTQEKESRIAALEARLAALEGALARLTEEHGTPLPTAGRNQTAGQ